MKLSGWSMFFSQSELEMFVSPSQSEVVFLKKDSQTVAKLIVVPGKVVVEFCVVPVTVNEREQSIEIGN